MTSDSSSSKNSGALRVITAGTHATIQDLGRKGYLGIGVTEGGAMDPFAHRLGQRLLGNDVGCASIETAWGGLTLEANKSMHCVITGAPVSVTIDDDAVPCHQVLKLEPGQRLKLGRPTDAVFSYVSVAGGIATEPVLGSRSTVVREGLGGLNGRTLAVDDLLPVGNASKPPPMLSVPMHAAPGADLLTLRFLPGFQYEQVPASASRTLENARFLISGARDRMGARLGGPIIETQMSQLWSEGICLGAIQIPPDGHPIVLLNDRQTMGGYPKLGAVLSVDCARLSQAPVGTQIRFEKLSPAAADRVLWLEQNYEQELARALAGNAL